MKKGVRYLCASLAGAALAVLGQSPARGDIFMLAQGGTIEGIANLSSREEAEEIEILTAEGGSITLARDQIVSNATESEHAAHYRHIAPSYADSVEGQLEIAQWCIDHDLIEQSKSHLRRILAHDEDHLLARDLLGYVYHDGNWRIPPEWHVQHGFIMYQRRWRTRQEIELLEEKKQYNDRVNQWLWDLSQWRSLLEREASPEVCQRIASINDPLAIPALAQLLEEESHQAVRLLYLSALREIETPESFNHLMQLSIDDHDEEIRLTSLEIIVAEHPPQAVSFYIDQLNNGDNGKLNRAAFALQLLNDSAAIEPLIYVLVTTHGIILQSGSEDSIRSTFSDEGPSFSTGRQKNLITRTFPNRKVLQALIHLTGTDYGYHQDGWKSWLATHRASNTPLINVRRSR